MEQYDLLIVADATASMGRFLASLNTSLPQIISVSEVTGCFSRIGLLAYRDYCHKNLLEWSGWLNRSPNDNDADEADPVRLAKWLQPTGGRDYPEAAKTALAKASEVMRSEATTVILLYADAPPHQYPKRGSESRNCKYEVEALSDSAAYGGWGPKFVDWVVGCNQLFHGEKRAQVFAILDRQIEEFNFLCTITRGACVELERSESLAISKVTMELLLTWMGVESPEQPGKTNDALPAKLSRYIEDRGIKNLKSEHDNGARPFLTTGNVTKTPMTRDSLERHLPKKPTPISDFAESWKTSPEFQALAVKNLKSLIDNDVMAITLNPVFGKLWRTICSDRTNDARDVLVDAFSLQVQATTNPEDKAHLEAWLESSYDYTTEVLSIIDSVPDEDKFPCVFLDPTLTFTRNADLDDEEDNTNCPLTALTRQELLEIGRSCDGRILRRLGRILTQLTYVETSADMPEHIASTSNEEVAKIPTVLAAKDYDRRFWKLLLHLIVPGTMLSARPAALLAALSLRLGMAPLTQAADREMLNFRNKWNDVEVPENWTVPCLSLLLDADDAYSQRQASKTNDPDANKDAPKRPTTLLKPSDRTLFENLVAYRMLELNLDSALTARIGWTPNKSTCPIGPLVVCRACGHPRSITIMGPNKKCGVCLSTPPDELDNAVNIGVSKEDGESTAATWVECYEPSCRAQYVVYNVGALNIRAKCHYCRVAGTQSQPKDNKGSKGQVTVAPWVECKKCLSRVIWPKSYRPASFIESDFVCPACSSGRETMEDVETTAKKLSNENSLSWLILDTENPGKSPFTQRSLYNTISTIGAGNFVSRIKLFPPTEKPLTLSGKHIQNQPSLLSTIRGFISRRQTEKQPCSLCFSDFRPSSLNPACGRRGCLQHICTSCLAGWYGLNGAGRIINTAALSCPFCRRGPSARTLAKYGMGIHAVRNLADAIRDRGTWIYAWCSACASAKQYVERVCARGMPAEVSDWTCDECQEAADRARVEQEVADEQIARAMQGVEATSDAERQAREKLDAIRLSKIKPCPKCGTMTEKSSGCGHIQCTVRGCLAHWCYYCGREFAELKIYRHMSKEHGGAFGNDYDDYEEHDDYDSDGDTVE